MKKRYILYVVIYIGLLIGAYNFGTLFRKEVPEFEITNSFKLGFDNYEQSRISVIVNVKEYDTEEMFDRVRNFYCEMNGEPDKLIIHLYNSEKNFESGNCHASKEFEKK